MRITRQKDFATGLAYSALGLVVSVVASGYRMGSAASMGPGYFPFWVGALLALVGASLLIGALRGEEVSDQKLTGWDLRSLGIVSLSIILFGLALTYLGLVAAVVVLVIVASLGSHEFSWRKTLINTAILLAITFVIFVWGLDLQFHIWPPILAN